MRSRSIGRYHFAGSDVAIHLRHGTVDVITLDEIFCLGDYDLPIQPPDPRPAAGGYGWSTSANIGLFGALIDGPSERMDGGVRAGSSHVELLRRSIEANGGQERWQLVEACAVLEDGMVPLSRTRTPPRAWKPMPLRRRWSSGRRLPFLQGVDSLKIHIVGAEWPILADLASGPESRRRSRSNTTLTAAPSPMPVHLR